MRLVERLATEHDWAYSFTFEKGHQVSKKMYAFRYTIFGEKFEDDKQQIKNNEIIITVKSIDMNKSLDDYREFAKKKAYEYLEKYGKKII